MIETIDAHEPSPTDELECENKFQTTHSRDSSGRYIIQLPLNSSSSQLGDSYIIAQRCLPSLLRWVSKNQSIYGMYHSFLQEYEKLKHVTHAQPINSLSPIYYLPHHGNLRE
ncbi:uncharacterized protein LOC127278221 isoform X2 [Leptopilina boulardi]|uniref:uncharacterized protein LOC127278221 isoform X2 n=1 Tax=Leptopilina boulardi TaxID=63433 RepID=UPI0021F68F7C|nr:uncharacterized protein LOC127278221 isoform X2 [Leptopilina boulardi]